MTTGVSRLIRWREWGHSKMPVFFAFGFVLLLSNDSSTPNEPRRIAAWILFCTLASAFGYSLNDFCDQDADCRAGKPNAMSRLPRTAAICVLIGLLTLGVVVLMPYFSQPWLGSTVGATFLLGIAYSLPPLRLKERGLAGLLTAAVAQRSMPSLAGAALVGHFGPDIWLLFALFTLIGLRWILLHQLIDVEADQRAGTPTFVRSFGYDRSLFALRGVIFPLEVIVLATWLVFSSYDSPELLLLIPFYLGYLRLKGLLWGRTWPAFAWTKYWLHPLADLYEVVLPLFLGVVAAVHDASVWPLVALLVLWQSPHASRQIASYRSGRTRGQKAPPTT